MGTSRVSDGSSREETLHELLVGRGHGDDLVVIHAAAAAPPAAAPAAGGASAAPAAAAGRGVPRASSLCIICCI